MNPTHPPVRLILDRSALLAYPTGSVHVAEPIHEVVQDRVLFGVPAVAAAEALADLADNADRIMLRRLLDTAACAVLATGEDWQELAYWRQQTGRMDLAACVMASLEHEAPILTAEAKHYGEGPVLIDIPEM